MKKILRILLYALLGIISGGLIFSYVYFATFSPGDSGIPVAERNLVYFKETYDDCRQSFLAAAHDLAVQNEQAEMFTLKVPSKIDSNLMIDFLYIPPLYDTSRLLVMTSGVHGVEGFTGSAIQQMFMKELFKTNAVSDMGVLLIHALNPYGFKYGRRVTENNIDLNRGSETDPALFENENLGYRELYDLLNPSGEISVYSLRNQFLYVIAISKMLKASMAVLRQAVLQGQYEFPEGLYYGGQDFEPQVDSLQKLLPELFKPYEVILVIDLHTGFGARRKLHLFSNPVNDPAIKNKTESIFEGQNIDWGDSDDFYTISGGFADAFLKKLNPRAEYLSMLFEWGTMDSQKTFGSLKSIQVLINENQGARYGYKKNSHKQKVKNQFLEMYYPSSEAWRSEVIEQGRDMLELVLQTYPGVN